VPAAAFDLDDALDKLGGDQDLLIEVIDTFRQEYPNQLLEIRRSVAAGDGVALSRAAHTLRGSVSIFSAAAAVQAALALELAGREGRLTGTPADLATLEDAVMRLDESLLAFAETTARASGPSP
jgi:HPt (histidine-containing phosphotransfer) domain-containing protein